MESAKGHSNDESSLQIEFNGRRSAHYKPNIWSYDYLESLVSSNNIPVGVCGAQVERLKEDFIHLFDEQTYASKLQMTDDIIQLGLNALFQKELKECLDVIESGLNTNNPSFDLDNLGSVALCFRLLRLHGYNVSQGLITEFLKKDGDHNSSNISRNIEGLIELYEACHLAVEDENSLIKFGNLSDESLKQILANSSDEKLTGQIADALDLPLHWTVQWFDARRRINAYQSEVTRSVPALLKLAKLNFNVVQSVHQKDLKDLTTWWKSVGLMENIEFARDRLVESFLWTVGVAWEPQYSTLRKCLTKVVIFVLVLDDLYDVFGSLDELESFTRAVERWSWDNTNRHLPDCMEMCFWALYRTTNDIAKEIEKEVGCPASLTFLKNGWADFCKALLAEAKWYNRGETPSLKEYLSSAWISSCGPLLSLVIFLMTTKTPSKENFNALKGLVYYSSLIIRLCNDLGTAAAELERGDSPSSILCYMREANVTEEVARCGIRDIIFSTWKKINGELVKQFPLLSTPANLIVNTARVCHFIYNDGDGFGVQDGETKAQIRRVLVDPLILD